MQCLKRLFRMARPKILRTNDGGEITLKNVSQATYNKIATIVNTKPGFDFSAAEEVDLPTAQAEAKPEVDLSSLHNVALGIYKGKDNNYNVAVVKFNPETGEAALDKPITSGPDRAEVNERFRLSVVKFGLFG